MHPVVSLFIFIAAHSAVCGFIWVVLHGQIRDALAMAAIYLYLQVSSRTGGNL
jgi:hypothetical protein